jgi:hypothetical protein
MHMAKWSQNIFFRTFTLWKWIHSVVTNIWFCSDWRIITHPHSSLTGCIRQSWELNSENITAMLCWSSDSLALVLAVCYIHLQNCRGFIIYTTIYLELTL